MPAQPRALLRIDDRPADGSHVVRLTGELDIATVPELEATVHRISGETTQVVLDLHGLSFMDSAGLAAILSCKQLCARSGCDFVLTPGRPQIERVLQLAGVVNALRVRGPRLDT